MEVKDYHALVIAVLLARICIASSLPMHGADITRTTLPTTTTATVPPGCFYKNKYYPPGSVVENGFDPSTNWCYGAHCDMDGHLQFWDDFNCKTTPPTTIPPTTIPGCFYNGRYYMLGSTIEKGYDPSSNWCYSTYCDMSGQILNGDDFNCKTTPPTTIPPTTPTARVVVG